MPPVQQSPHPANPMHRELPALQSKMRSRDIQIFSLQILNEVEKVFGQQKNDYTRYAQYPCNKGRNNVYGKVKPYHPAKKVEDDKKDKAHYRI